MNYPKIFVINLKRSVDRKKHMEKVLSELPIKVEFVEAIDGKELSDEKIFQVYDDEICKKNINRSLSKPEISIALNHIKVWKLLQKQNIEDAFVMEDDVMIKDKKVFLEILKNRNCFPKNWEIVLFAHGCSRENGKGTETSFFHTQKIYEKYKIARFIDIAFGALGYLIHSRTIEKLLSNSKIITGPVDNLYTGNSQFVELYGIKPVLIEEDQYFGNRSTISDQREKSKKKIKTTKDISIKIIDLIEIILQKIHILKTIKNFYQEIRRLKRSVPFIKIYKISTLEKRK